MDKAATPKTAFVFAGGGSLGAVQVGMLKALVAHGWTADFVVGSSVGAINAAQYASDPTPGGVARLEEVWRGLRRSDVFPIAPLRGLVRLFFEHGHIVETSGLEQILRRHLAVARLEETRLPCHVIATDLLDGTEIVQSQGPAVEALLASTAIPGVFPARHIQGRYVVDGAVANHTPLSVAVELGATRIVVLPTGYSCTLSEPPRGVIGIALHGLNLLIARQLVAAIRHYQSIVEVVVVPPLCPLGVAPYDFGSASCLIDRAQASTEDWLANGVELIDGVPHQLPPHSHQEEPHAAELRSL
jgi:NTE family protein